MISFEKMQAQAEARLDQVVEEMIERARTHEGFIGDAAMEVVQKIKEPHQRVALVALAMLGAKVSIATAQREDDEIDSGGPPERHIAETCSDRTFDQIREMMNLAREDERRKMEPEIRLALDARQRATEREKEDGRQMLALMDERANLEEIIDKTIEVLRVFDNRDDSQYAHRAELPLNVQLVLSGRNDMVRKLTERVEELSKDR